MTSYPRHSPNERSHGSHSSRCALSCCRRSNALDTLKTHWSADRNNDAVWFGANAFAYDTKPDLVGRMRPFAKSRGILRDDAVANCDAFITNECRRAGDELSNGALRTVAERATLLPPLPEWQQ
jgi:hypothetical protein